MKIFDRRCGPWVKTCGVWVIRFVSLGGPDLGLIRIPSLTTDSAMLVMDMPLLKGDLSGPSLDKRSASSSCSGSLSFELH